MGGNCGRHKHINRETKHLHAIETQTQRERETALKEEKRRCLNMKGIQITRSEWRKRKKRNEQVEVRSAASPLNALFHSYADQKKNVSFSSSSFGFISGSHCLLLLSWPSSLLTSLLIPHVIHISFVSSLPTAVASSFSFSLLPPTSS